MSSTGSTLYVSGLKEQSEAAVASAALRPCMLWSTKSWREGREGEEENEDSQLCLHKTSLNVALRLGGRSREESMLLQACVWLGRRGSVRAGGRWRLSVGAEGRGRVSVGAVGRWRVSVGAGERG